MAPQRSLAAIPDHLLDTATALGQRWTAAHCGGAPAPQYHRDDCASSRAGRCGDSPYLAVRRCGHCDWRRNRVPLWIGDHVLLCAHGLAYFAVAYSVPLPVVDQPCDTWRGIGSRDVNTNT